MIANGKPPRRRPAGCLEQGKRAWRVMVAVSLLASPALATRAFAQDEKPEAPSLPEPSDDAAPPEADQFQTMEQEIAELKERMAELEAEVAILTRELGELRQEVERLSKLLE